MRLLRLSFLTKMCAHFKILHGLLKNFAALLIAASLRFFICQPPLRMFSFFFRERRFRPTSDQKGKFVISFTRRYSDQVVASGHVDQVPYPVYIIAKVETSPNDTNFVLQVNDLKNSFDLIYLYCFAHCP